MMNLETVRARLRAAISARCQLPASVLEKHSTAFIDAAQDTIYLIGEVVALRAALAARVMTGDQMTLREAVRTVLIDQGAEASAQVDAVRALHAPVEQDRVYCAYVGMDRPDCLTCYPSEHELGVGHTRMVCGHCQRPRHVGYTDEPAWPCETIKALDYDQDASTPCCTAEGDTCPTCGSYAAEDGDAS